MYFGIYAFIISLVFYQFSLSNKKINKYHYAVILIVGTVFFYIDYSQNNSLVTSLKSESDLAIREREAANSERNFAERERNSAQQRYIDLLTQQEYLKEVSINQLKSINHLTGLVNFQGNKLSNLENPFSSKVIVDLELEISYGNSIIHSSNDLLNSNRFFRIFEEDLRNFDSSFTLNNLNQVDLAEKIAGLLNEVEIQYLLKNDNSGSILDQKKNIKISNLVSTSKSVYSTVEFFSSLNPNIKIFLDYYNKKIILQLVGLELNLNNNSNFKSMKDYCGLSFVFSAQFVRDIGSLKLPRYSSNFKLISLKSNLMKPFKFKSIGYNQFRFDENCF